MLAVAFAPLYFTFLYGCFDEFINEMHPCFEGELKLSFKTEQVITILKTYSTRYKDLFCPLKGINQ